MSEPESHVRKFLTVLTGALVPAGLGAWIEACTSVAAEHSTEFRAVLYTAIVGLCGALAWQRDRRARLERALEAATTRGRTLERVEREKEDLEAELRTREELSAALAKQYPVRERLFPSLPEGAVRLEGDELVANLHIWNISPFPCFMEKGRIDALLNGVATQGRDLTAEETGLVEPGALRMFTIRFPMPTTPPTLTLQLTGTLYARSEGTSDGLVPVVLGSRYHLRAQLFPLLSSLQGVQFELGLMSAIDWAQHQETTERLSELEAQLDETKATSEERLEAVQAARRTEVAVWATAYCNLGLRLARDKVSVSRVLKTLNGTPLPQELERVQQEISALDEFREQYSAASLLTTNWALPSNHVPFIEFRDRALDLTNWALGKQSKLTALRPSASDSTGCEGPTNESAGNTTTGSS